MCVRARMRSVTGGPECACECELQSVTGGSGCACERRCGLSQVGGTKYELQWLAYPVLTAGLSLRDVDGLRVSCIDAQEGV